MNRNSPKFRPKLLFRVDGGRVWGISMGHIMRCMILSDALIDRFDIVFIMKNYSDGINYVVDRGISTEVVDANDDSDETLKSLCDKHRPEAVIFDLRENPYSYFFDYSRSMGIKTVVFDITGRCRGVPDVLINDSFVKEFVDYRHLAGRTTLYIGPEYFLLDKAYEINEIRQSVEDIMITMGGSDPAGLTGRITAALLKGSRVSCRIDIVLGPAFTKHDEINRLAEAVGNISIHNNPPDFLELLACQDIVITAAGRTLYECAYFGRPVIVVPSIEHEAITAKEFSEITGGFDIGLWDERESSDKLLDMLNMYSGNYELRKSVSEASRKIIDGNGLKRVLEAIGPFLN